MKIDIGGGRNPREGYKCLDIIDEADFKCNIEHERFPFEDDSVEKFYSHHCLEHIDNISHVMNEVYRCLALGGTFSIYVPHKDCVLAWQDPTHKRYFVEESFKFFCGEYLKKYKLLYDIKCCFKKIEVETTAPDNRPEYFREIFALLQKDLRHVKIVNYPELEEQINKNKTQAPLLLDKVLKSRREQFKTLTMECQALFERKNLEYGDAYFTGGYSDKERWLSIQRKIKRLDMFYREGKQPSGETLKDTWQDLANYAIMELMILEDKDNDTERKA